MLVFLSNSSSAADIFCGGFVSFDSGFFVFIGGFFLAFCSASSRHGCCGTREEAKSAQLTRLSTDTIPRV